ncbi:helix-turn-helix domain-containing protein [Afifella marina]|uniref:Transcriptional regulator, Nlp family n=1 Tax=Afifella marina DSM 2698 TaxID=1120955 RepID=A0A1G5MF19_AFIMA|nr:helix-turn-helix domain-containing protein [Afifella marina]MBK1625227.1 hypothetical protein [Afifella marina DSM 2698]MBK1628944.1 hypothetical protein [Afifella marina]MBK5918323.1 hypothetical protein [Afifella marina]RAI22841.1 hypothetical protein CH311_04095 [Afifella marina DSM 2698]SCZ23752.1 transcriptional regulator, Nlp family [Afifella marina DSM 2698]
MAKPKQQWDRFTIKAEVQRRGYTLTQVAQEAGLSESACRVALYGTSRAGAEALSAFLDVPVGDLFPGLYLRARSNRRKANPEGTRESRQKRRPSTDSASAQAS